MDYAFKFVVKNGGIDTEEDYPFREVDGTCNKNKVTWGCRKVPSQTVQMPLTMPCSCAVFAYITAEKASCDN